MRALIDKRKKTVLEREAGLSSKVVFNRKVANALGAPRGQVTLLQVREHTWNTVIVDARREFVVNKLKLEAFETEERQVCLVYAP